MGNLLNLSGVRENAWQNPIKEMVYTINCLLKDYPDSSDVVIVIMNNDGANFQVEWNWIGKEDEFLTKLIKGAIELAKSKVEKICIKCGVDKGMPPSLTVHPAYCEKCRSQFVPEDYKDNVIVCMSGKAGSGKDTVADYLVSKHRFQRMAFADPLRDIVQLVFVLDHDSVWDRNLRELPLKNFPNLTDKKVVEFIEYYRDFFKVSYEQTLAAMTDDQFWTVRKLLQYIGTEMFRNLIHRDTWVMNFSQRIEPGVNYVLTDVRFPNEMDWVRKKFGGRILFVDVTREGCDGKAVGLENHESEKYKLPSDITIENNGTLEELYTKITNMIVNTLKV